MYLRHERLNFLRRGGKLACFVCIIVAYFGDRCPVGHHRRVIHVTTRCGRKCLELIEALTNPMRRHPTIGIKDHAECSINCPRSMDNLEQSSTPDGLNAIDTPEFG